MREAGGRYVALDGRLWKTLGALLFRPGFLTREYFAGRRRRYIRPARLFLVASLLMFAALRIVADLGHLDVVQFDAAEKPAVPTNKDKAGSGIQFDDDGMFGADVLEIPTLKERIDRFNRLSRQEKGAQITDGVLRYGPYAMIVLLPAFALLLKILYLGRRRRYPLRPRLYAEHIVFAAHDHAFLFLAIIAATVFVGFARAAVIVWMLVYMLWSLRVVYGGSWLGIAMRSFVHAHRLLGPVRARPRRRSSWRPCCCADQSAHGACAAAPPSQYLSATVGNARMTHVLPPERRHRRCVRTRSGGTDPMGGVDLLSGAARARLAPPRLEPAVAVGLAVGGALARPSGGAG